MACPEALLTWEETVSSHLPSLSRCQARMLAWWSFGIATCRCSGQTVVSTFLAVFLNQAEPTMRQRLREWCYEAKAKRGAARQAVEVRGCFPALLRWVIAWWQGDEHRLALALDATTLGQRFTVLAISVLYRGCAIPVAWQVVRATEAGAWQPEWEALLRCLHGSIPAGWQVIVCADRGLYAKWLYQTIQARHWHPFLRITQRGMVRRHGQDHYVALAQVVDAQQPDWSGTVTCYRTMACRLECTLLAHCDAAHADPWLILTDLPPPAGQIAWYGMRMWIEQGFKDFKRGGWQWQQTKMTDPQRAARLWLAMAVALLWVASQTADDPAPSHLRVSCPLRGWVRWLCSLLHGSAVTPGFQDFPWPTHVPCPNTYP